jgi:hypothetical protein
MPAPAPAPRPVRRSFPRPSLIDAIYALALIAAGFCYWEWQLIWMAGNGLGTTLFFLWLLAWTFAYLQAKGIRQTWRSLLLLAAATAGSLPYALWGYRDINGLLILSEGCLCLLWLACSCRTVLGRNLNLLLAGDFINQTMIIPWTNFGRLFSRLFGALTNDDAKPAKRTRPNWAPILIALAGLVVAIPVLFLVISLLAASDDGFSQLVDWLTSNLDTNQLLEWVFKLVLGLPIACFIFGAVFGNAFRNHSDHLSSEGLLRGFAAAHKLPCVALYGALGLLIAIYIVYFIAMASYLFSALAGELPTSYTYAQYARQGFFELCGVAFINLLILAVTWLFARRSANQRPKALRLLGGAISVLTCLLVLTAMSKMLLYIDTYGLSRLRIYTFTFMLLLLVVFVLLSAWHLKAFNAARPAVICTILLYLALALTNSDALIAGFNVNRYLAEETRIMDVSQFGELGDAAVPALARLAAESPDASIRKQANDSLNQWNDYPNSMFLETSTDSWYDYNLNRLVAGRILSQ